MHVGNCEYVNVRRIVYESGACFVAVCVKCHRFVRPDTVTYTGDAGLRPGVPLDRQAPDDSCLYRSYDEDAQWEFGLGVIQVGLGFLVLVWGAQSVGVDVPTPLIFMFSSATRVATGSMSVASTAAGVSLAAAIASTPEPVPRSRMGEG